jgi:histidinol-phosphate aminotransferase
MISPTPYVKRMKPYKIVSHETWKNRHSDPVFKLDWNENFAKPSPLVYARLAEALNKFPLNWYPDTNNKALLQKLSEYNGLNKDCITYMGGSDVCIENILDTYLRAGDKMIVVYPTYDQVRAYAEIRGIRVDYFFIKDFRFLDIEQLVDFIRDRSDKLRCLYLCNPNNPTGHLTDKSKIQKLLDEFQHILFIVDEAYYEFSGVSVKDLIDRENLIITRSFSKAFALASLRIGYIISSPKNISWINNVRNPKNINMLSQVAAIAALEDLDYLDKTVISINWAKRTLYRFFKDNGIHFYPSEANFILFKSHSPKILLKRLKDQSIYLRDFSHLKYLENHMRLTIPTKDGVEDLLKALNKNLELLASSKA